MHDLLQSEAFSYCGVIATFKTSAKLIAQLESLGLLLQAFCIYDKAACQEFLQCSIDDLSNERLARCLALACYRNAQKIRSDKIFGLAAIEDDNNIIVALQLSDTAACKIVAASSLNEELIFQLVAKTLIQFLSSAKPIANQVLKYELKVNTSLSQSLIPLYSGDVDRIYPYQSSPEPIAIFSGSWTPLTREHLYMASIAEVFCEDTVYFETAINGVGRPPLDFIEAESLIKQFEGMHLVVTRASTFLEKANLFPNSTFIVGIDTWLEIINPKYYQFSIEELLHQFKNLNTQFLVFGRQIGDKFISLENEQSFGIARKVPQHVLSANPEDDYESESEMKKILQKEKYEKPKKVITGL